MNNENERIKQIRKSLKMSQEGFGEVIGLTKSSISNIENGVRNVTDQHIRLICSEFNVNGNWLRNGTGDMFIENDSSIITELASEYHLDAIDKKIIEHYVNLDSEIREKVKKYVVDLASQITSLEETAASDDTDIDIQVEQYRQELVAEKKIQTSSVSQKPNIG